jgi:hypothetical protein
MSRVSGQTKGGNQILELETRHYILKLQIFRNPWTFSKTNNRTALDRRAEKVPSQITAK